MSSAAPYVQSGENGNMGPRDWGWAIGVSLYCFLIACLLLPALYSLWPPPVPQVQPGFTLYAADPVQIFAKRKPSPPGAPALPSTAPEGASFNVAVVAIGRYTAQIDLTAAPAPGTDNAAFADIHLTQTALTPGTVDVMSTVIVTPKATAAPG